MNADRLSGLDASFLHLERNHAHMHVGSVLIFEGDAPTYDELVDHIERRLHLVPRYRQRLAFVPLGQGRPVWVDDPHFNLRFHLRHTALPAPGSEQELKRLAGRLFSQELDRSKPLWELWLAEGLNGGRFAIVAKTHHALVDGVSGVDLATVLFDLSPEPDPLPEPEPWTPRPLPSDAQLLADALLERATVPSEIVRGIMSLTRAPRQALGAVAEGAAGLGAVLKASFGAGAASDSPLNVEIGPHRRFTWVEASLDRCKAIKNELGGTVNDVVLTSVALALGRYLRDLGHDTDGMELKAMVPVSVRADVERGALGNRVAAMYAPLPVGVEDPLDCFAIVHEAMGDLKRSGQAVGAEVIAQLSGFAPPTIMAQAARLTAHQRLFNLVVTNVPGPQFPLFLLGRRLDAIHPHVPLAQRQALGVAIMSYDGKLCFGLTGDYDAMERIEELGDDLEAALDELALAAGVEASGRRDGANGRPPLGFAMPRARPRTPSARRRSTKSPR